jgi:hypothetical protein
MYGKYTVHLKLSPDQAGRLRSLQALFAEACNFISPMAAVSRCWNRVGLHHLAYKAVRERYPQLGSQMVSNAIYSVSRASRRVYQDPQSQWFVGRNATATLPRLRFSPDNPVFFDRHTLSLKSGVLSMFTLDGRLRFQVQVPRDLEERFANDKLREVVLLSKGQNYALRFVFGELVDKPNLPPDPDAPEFKVEVEMPVDGAEVERPLSQKEAA